MVVLVAHGSFFDQTMMMRWHDGWDDVDDVKWQMERCRDAKARHCGSAALAVRLRSGMMEVDRG